MIMNAMNEQDLKSIIEKSSNSSELSRLERVQYIMDFGKVFLV